MGRKPLLFSLAAHRLLAEAGRGTSAVQTLISCCRLQAVFFRIVAESPELSRLGAGHRKDLARPQQIHTHIHTHITPLFCIPEPKLKLGRVRI